MTHLLPARAALRDQAPDLIIDGRLALSEEGLLVSLALAATRRCWLVPALWALLQRFEVIDYPEFADAAEDVRPMLPALREWHAVWTGTSLMERFCWVGDMPVESRLPPEFDQAAARRLHGFASLLERFADGAGDGEPMSSLTLCARDAAALAALNAIDAPLILTLAESAGPPRLCRFLSRAGVECTQVTGRQASWLMRAALGPQPPQALALALVRGSCLAAVSLFAPRAIAAAIEDEADFEPDDTAYWEERDPWRGASALWCEVSA